ncbi:PKD domain-containing protein [Myxococcota bacterium]|nr:PKD domain-containing protein [Myxococcota bacterium]
MPRVMALPSLFLLASFVACGDKVEDSTETGVAVNTPPSANAGVDQTVSADGAVSLDGSGSYDADGDTLTYRWEFEHVPDDSTIQSKEAPFSRNGSAEAATTTFTPDAIGTYVVSLWVSDGEEQSAKDYVVITTQTPDTLPVADAGDDVTVDVDAVVSLDGSGSYDPLGRAVTYAWTIVDTPDASSLTALAGADTASASFTADARGVYVINLVVDNGLTSSLADAVIITAVGEDSAPTANAGEDIVAEDCTAISLDGSGSVDPDGDKLKYSWEIQKKPAGSKVSAASFSDATAAEPTFFADIAGEYRLSLSVNDGTSWSAPDLLTLTVGERSYNTAPKITITDFPVIDAGEAECEESGYTYNCDDCSDQTISWGTNVTVTDADGDAYTSAWTLSSGSGVIASSTSIETSVKLEDITCSEPGVTDDNEYVFSLTVIDCTGASTTATGTATAQCTGVEATE